MPTDQQLLEVAKQVEQNPSQATQIWQAVVGTANVTARTVHGYLNGFLNRLPANMRMYDATIRAALNGLAGIDPRLPGVAAAGAGWVSRVGLAVRGMAAGVANGVVGFVTGTTVPWWVPASIAAATTAAVIWGVVNWGRPSSEPVLPGPNLTDGVRPTQPVTIQPAATSPATSPATGPAPTAATVWVLKPGFPKVNPQNKKEFPVGSETADANGDKRYDKVTFATAKGEIHRRWETKKELIWDWKLTAEIAGEVPRELRPGQKFTLKLTATAGGEKLGGFHDIVTGIGSEGLTVTSKNAGKWVGVGNHSGLEKVAVITYDFEVPEQGKGIVIEAYIQQAGPIVRYEYEPKR